MFAKNVIGAVMKYETLIMIVLMKIILALKKKALYPITWLTALYDL